MKVVFIKNNNFFDYKLLNVDGYLFKPRNKNIYSLIIVNGDMIKYILSKKILKEINKAKKAISLIINSDVTLVSDCDMMSNEVIRISNKLENKYRQYFDKFEYFDLVKDLYILNTEINLKKKLIEEIENNE